MALSFNIRHTNDQISQNGSPKIDGGVICHTNMNRSLPCKRPLATSLVAASTTHTSVESYEGNPRPSALHYKRQMYWRTSAKTIGGFSGTSESDSSFTQENTNLSINGSVATEQSQIHIDPPTCTRDSHRVSCLARNMNRSVSLNIRSKEEALILMRPYNVNGGGNRRPIRGTWQPNTASGRVWRPCHGSPNDLRKKLTVINLGRCNSDITSSPEMHF